MKKQDQRSKYVENMSKLSNRFSSRPLVGLLLIFLFLCYTVVFHRKRGL